MGIASWQACQDAERAVKVRVNPTAATTVDVTKLHLPVLLVPSNRIEQ